MRPRPQSKTPSATVLICCLAAAVAAMFMLKQCSSPTHTDRDMRAGGDTLNIAVEASPTGVDVAADTLCGFNHDLALAVGRVMKRPVRLTPYIGLQQALARLDAGRFDIIAASVPSIKGLKSRYLFTDPLHIDRQVIVRRRDSISAQRPFSAMDLAGDTVSVEAGSAAFQRLRHLQDELGDTIYIVEDSDYGAEQLIMMTATGDVRQCVVANEAALAIAPQYPQLEIVDVSLNQFQAWLLRADSPALLAEVNSALDSLRRDGEFERIARKYFSKTHH